MEVLQKLKRRAKTKYLQSSVLGSLIDLNNERKSHYLKATQCCNVGAVQDKKLFMFYCKSRVCQVCNRNRSGRLMNQYMKTLEQRQMRFVTLTIPNVDEERLADSVAQMKHAFLRIRRKWAYQGRNLNGLYTTEITYNWKADTYHPHIHALIECTADESLYIIADWFAYWDKRGIKLSRYAQDERPADKGAFSEVFKYAIKFDYGLPDENGKIRLKYTAQAVDNILAAIWGKRMVITFGDVRALDEEYQEEAILQWHEENDAYIWHTHDWWSVTTGEALANYSPEYVTKQLSRRRIGGPPKVGQVNNEAPKACEA